jgi:CheY-like chemotaxis protein
MIRLAMQASSRRISQESDRRRLVLIIDEDQSARDVYGHWFILHGYQVMCAVGREGLEMALRSELPSLVVTELRARDLTLQTLFTRLHCDDNTRCIPVLVVTKSTDEQTHSNAVQMGAVAVIPKLIGFEQLYDWVQALTS